MWQRLGESAFQIFLAPRMNIEDWKTELYMLKSVVVKGGVAPYA
jgi:hypothetical protein